MVDLKKRTLAEPGEEAYTTLKQLLVTLSWSASVDLDLMAFYKAKDGRTGGVYSTHYAQGSMGDLNAFPFIALSTDAGVGAQGGKSEESLRISRMDDLLEVFLCTVNFSDAAADRPTPFQSYDAKVTLRDDKGAELEVPLDAATPGNVAILARLDNSSFMGVRLINDNRVLSLAELQRTIPGAAALNVQSKKAALEARMAQQAPHLLDLTKKASILLKKKNLDTHKARVGLCLDISGSMGGLYRSGKIQRLAEKVLALGCRFDDDGQIDIFLFGGKAHTAGEMGIDNFHTFVDQALKRTPLEGATYYGRAMQHIRDFYFPGATSSHRTAPVKTNQPVYLMFLTDGATFDEEVAQTQLRQSSFEPLFWQFMGIGASSKDAKKKGFFGRLLGGPGEFAFLEKLDSLSGRFLDNANFFSVEDPEGVADEELYELLMAEYPGWLSQARQKGLLPPG